MKENSGPIIKIDDFKNRLADYVEREYPGVMKREEVFEVVENTLCLIRKVKADFLDKILVNWRGYNVMVNLQIALALKKGSLSFLEEISTKMFDCLPVFFGQELLDAAKTCVKDGEYNRWYLSKRLQMWKNGTWPIAGSPPPPDSGD